MSFIFFLIAFGIFVPIPFIFAYYKIERKANKQSKLIQQTDSAAKKNLCTLAEELQVQNYITKGFYFTGILLFVASIGYLYQLYNKHIFPMVTLWGIILILFIISGRSTFDHTGKIHNISSRLLIVLLMIGTIFFSYQIALKDIAFGLILALVVIIAGISTIYRINKVKFVDKEAQMIFHIGFSIWNLALCLYLILRSI